MARKFAIEEHPDSKMLIDKLLAGQSAYSVAKLANLSAQSVQAYRRRYILPALQNAAKLSLAKDLKETGDIPDNQTQGIAASLVRAEPVIARIEAKFKKIKLAYDMARLNNKPSDMVLAERADTDALRLLCEITGLIGGKATAGDHSVTVILHNPATLNPPSQTIDVQPVKD